MGYKLADGSDSSDYEVGDEFEACEHTGAHSIGEKLPFKDIRGDDAFNSEGSTVIEWSWVKPTPATLEKVRQRKSGAAIGKASRVLEIQCEHDETQIDYVNVNGVRFYREEK